MAPPPTRGWTPLLGARIGNNGGSPAYAGMDPTLGRADWEQWRLPRLRGDGPCMSRKVGRGSPAPPPTRGWTPVSVHLLQHGPGSPAYAGMDPSISRMEPTTRRLPRLRGDGPLVAGGNYTLKMAPPPTRGWTHPDLHAGRRHPGSPAYAGMNPMLRPWLPLPAWLPRLRGDGPLRM